MTIQDALDYFIRRKEQLGISDKIQQAETLAISALEKQIPKRPTPHKVNVPKIKVGNVFLEKAQQFIVALVVTNL